MANEQLISEIVSQKANEQVNKLTADLVKANSQMQDTILAAKALNDTLASAKGYNNISKASAETQKANDLLAAGAARRQLAEEKLAAFQASEQVKADARATKELVATNKQIDADNKRTAALERRTRVIKESTAADIASSGSNSTKRGRPGRTVNTNDINSANAANAAVAETGALQQNTRATNQNTVSKRQQAIAEAQAKEALRQNNLELRNQARELNAAKGSLEQRAAALARLQRTYAALNEQERNSAYGRRLSTVIPQLNQQVLTLEQSMGRSQRNVGNYVSGFDRLTQGAGRAFGILRQVAYILPGVGIAGLIGFLTDPIVKYIASLDIFKDKLSQIKENLKALNEVNKATSLGGADEITTLKILYNAATDVNLAMSDRVKAANELRKTYPESFKNSTNQAILNGKEAETYRDLTKEILINARAKAVRDKLADIEAKRSDIAFQKEKIRIANANEVQKQVNEQLKGQASVQAQRTPAQQKAFATSTAQTNKLINDNIINPAKERANAAIAIQNIQDKLLEGQSKFLIKYAGQANLVDSVIRDRKEPKDKKEKITTNQLDELRAQVEAERNAQDEIVKDETKSLDIRLNALANFTNLSEQLNEIDAARKIKHGKDISKTRAEQLKDDEKAEIEYNQRKYKINEDAVKKLTDLLKQGATDSLNAEINKNSKVLDDTSTVLENIENRRAEAQLKLSQEYSKNNKTKAQYDKESFLIDKKYADESLNTQIDALETIIDSELEFARYDEDINKKLSKDKRDLAALRIRLSKNTADAEIADSERVKAKNQETLDNIKKVTQEVFDFGKALGDATFTRRINGIEKEKSALTERTNLEIANVQASTATEQEKADRIAVINAKAASDQAVLDERVKQQKIKQAKFDKAAAIAQIIIQTALAQIKTIGALGPLGFAFSPLITALGAISLAAAIATPIPEYKTGKGPNNKYSGHAIVGDGGMSELIIEPDGSMSVTPNKPTLTTVGRDTQIVSGPDFKRMLANPNMSHNVKGTTVDISRLVQSNDRMGSRVEKAIGKQKVNAYVETEKGRIKKSISLDKHNSWIKRNFRR